MGQDFAVEIFAIKSRRATLEQAGQVGEVNSRFSKLGADFFRISVEIMERPDERNESVGRVQRALEILARQVVGCHEIAVVGDGGEPLGKFATAGLIKL